MTLRRSWAPATALLLALAAIAARPQPPAIPDLHLDLAGSAPAADSTVTSPDELRLWFTQVPQAGGTSVRLVDAAQELVELGELEQDAEDGKVFRAAVPSPLAGGAYSVRWRAMAADGHVVTGDFGFRVRGDQPAAGTAR